MDKKISISQLKEVAQEAYEQVKGNTGGKNADYIPYLANIDKNLFGISICLMNGQTINIGDTDYRFGIESVSKVHTAILILRQYGAQKMCIRDRFTSSPVRTEVDTNRPSPSKINCLSRET